MRIKMSKQPPPAPTASAVGPCPTVIQIVGRPGRVGVVWTFLLSYFLLFLPLFGRQPDIDSNIVSKGR